MPIIRTNHTTNFTVIPNAVTNDAPLSLEAIGLWEYLISKPKTWNFNAKAIKQKFHIGLNKVYRIMRELIQAGYAFYKRTQSAVIWFIYDTPQNIKPATTHAVIDRVNFECVKNECVLERNELLEKNTTTPIPPETIIEPDTVIPVVVSLEEEEKLKFPKQLNKEQLKDAKHRIKKAQVELRQDVLFELLYRFTKTKLYNPIGYLRTLIKAANGESPTFAYKLDKAFMASINKTTEAKKPPKELPKVDNNSHFAWLLKTYGKTGNSC